MRARGYKVPQGHRRTLAKRDKVLLAGPAHNEQEVISKIFQHDIKRIPDVQGHDKRSLVEHFHPHLACVEEAKVSTL